MTASKLAPRFIGPFGIIKPLGDAYTLDIPSSLRPHPTFHVRRLNKYRPAIIPESPQATEAHASSDLRDVQPERHVDEFQSSPGPSIHLQIPQALLPRGPPPIVDADVETRWIVDHIVEHEDLPRVSARANRGPPSARRYKVRRLGLPADNDTREPRSVLLRDIPDTIHDYKNDVAATASANVVGDAHVCKFENENAGAYAIYAHQAETNSAENVVGALRAD
ncbi:hypothetical protein PHMEG_0009370 [Phytophthora megakarya]|uniref:Tf2-1-like SH3-like domain-containing protein n=1 Tax=Phytophthora megakarya TaxID=4795 RepID=A0A225WHS2_9STRA|nr:hypothetical protein PHMEG_0009370 [Phytophthora megakarya]